MFNISKIGIFKRKNLDNITLSKICEMVFEIRTIDEIFDIIKDENKFLFCIEEIFRLLQIN